MRSKFLLFHTNYDAEIVNVKINKGMARIKDMEFPVNNVRHFNIKTFFGSVPLYIFKWDSIHPIEYDTKTSEEAVFVDESGKEIKLVREELVPIEELEFKRSGKLTPEFIRDTSEIRFLRAMKRYVEGKPGIPTGIIPIVLALILGMVIMYMLFASKIMVV